MDGHDLEQLTPLLLVTKPVDGNFQLGNPFRIGRRDYCGPGTDPEAVQPVTLGDYRCHRCARLASGSTKRLEIHMRSEILFSRIAQCRDISMAADRLERISRRALFVTIIDENSDTPALV